MQKKTHIQLAFAALTIAAAACNNGINHQIKTENKMKQQANVASTTADKWVKSSLRNHIALELNASVSDVWALIGDPAKMPTYSSGLNKVETQTDASGKCTTYTCYFKPMEVGGEEIAHEAKMVWYEPNKGWASLDEEPNAFGFQQSLTLIALEGKGNKTVLYWSMHFDCENQEMLQLNVASLEQALNGEIAQQLIEKFGGKVLDSYVDGKSVNYHQQPE